MSLTATFRDGATRMALLDGRMVRQGDEVRGYVLDTVEESRVTLKRGNEILVVRMASR